LLVCLFNLVQKQGALPELEAVGYIKQIGEALIFVHHQGLVHRDAQPGNIMVQKMANGYLLSPFLSPLNFLTHWR
jgi:serine/threonine protein kinase